MSTQTNIEWADSTFNPWTGCTKVGPGCDRCYAEARMDKRLHTVKWGPGQERKRTSLHNWRQPVLWNARAFVQCDTCGWRGEKKSLHACPVCTGGTCTPVRRRVFCASLADVFDNEVPNVWRQHLMTLVADTPNLDWLFLTKRIGNAARMLLEASLHDGRLLTAHYYRPPANLWLGATIVNQAEADRDIPKLLATPAAVRFLSMEPLLGSVCLTELQPPGAERVWIDALRGSAAPLAGAGSSYRTSRIDWVIAGGESGHGARPMHPDWVRSLRDQCAADGVPFLFKQWGEWAPRDEWSFHASPRKQVAIKIDGTQVSHDDAPQDVGGQRFELTGKKAAGRLLDGVEHNGFPEVRS